MIPVRIQRKRTRGWKMPPNTVSVTRPGKWGNSFRVGIDGSAAECVVRYFQLIAGNVWTSPNAAEIQTELRGKNLACYCRLCKIHRINGKRLGTACADCTPCHADVLLEIANAAGGEP